MLYAICTHKILFLLGQHTHGVWIIKVSDSEKCESLFFLVKNTHIRNKISTKKKLSAIQMVAIVVAAQICGL